eukprot:TRINITY_DN5328_c0_g1_i4.p1 TRINITY_DN5328_c0_g1~~TRINITY_DN5328_c0_g1_i4.p1  ORF type:complete len:133 (-),score=15.06 TRINITY_DN5328_c0_g1_i4:361-759(-)
MARARDCPNCHTRVQDDRVSIEVDGYHGISNRRTVRYKQFEEVGLLTSPSSPFLLFTLFFSYNGWFVDLFVRASNVAVLMYEKLGYITYRRVKDYYHDEGGKKEDGLGVFLAILLPFHQSISIYINPLDIKI